VSINLVNLTEPWFACIPQTATANQCWLQDAKADVHLFGELRTANATALEFVALARQAFAVMMRRGWGLVHTDAGWWAVQGYEVLNVAVQPDPFTAILDADRLRPESST